MATKFGHAYHGFQDRTRHWTAAEMHAQLHESLRALGTDYVDLLQYHSLEDKEFLKEELWEALAWPLRHPAVTAVIPGCKSVEQVRANARAAGHVT